MRRSWLLACAFASACFSEPSGQVGGTSSGCPDGSQGCACYGNGTCDGELACRDGACVPAGCTAGALDCTCVDRACLGELVCDARGVCVEAGGTSGATSTSSSPSTSTSGVDATSIMGSAGPDDGSEVGMVGTGLVPACDQAGMCASCLACASESDCTMKWSECTALDACANLSVCVADCPAVDAECIADCGNQFMSGIGAYAAFLDCATCFCPVSCPSLAGECG